VSRDCKEGRDLFEEWKRKRSDSGKERKRDRGGRRESMEETVLRDEERREKLGIENRYHGKQHIPSKCHQFFTYFFKGNIWNSN